VIEQLEERFGAMREERLARTRGFIRDIVQAKLEEDDKKSKAGYQKKGAQDSGKWNREGQSVVARGVVKVKVDASAPPSDGSVRIRTDAQNAVEDVQWAISVLAPLGLREDGEDLNLQPPAKVALPILKGLQAAAAFSDLRTILRKTQVGKVINYLRRNPDAAVQKHSKDLLRIYRDACAKKQKTEDTSKTEYTLTAVDHNAKAPRCDPTA